MSIRAALERKAKAKIDANVSIKNAQKEVQAAHDKKSQAKENCTRFDMLWAAMESDLQALKGVEDLEAKRQFKQGSLVENNFIEYFDEEIRTLSLSNRLMRWIFIWLVDVADWGRVIHAMTRIIDTQKEPVTFKSDWIGFLCNQIDDFARQRIADLEENGRIESDNTYEILSTFCELLMNYRYVSPEKFDKTKIIALAKPFALAAKAALIHSDTTKALRYATFANDVNDKSGVKKIIDAARKQLGY